MYCFGAQFCSGAAVIEIYLGTAVYAAHCAGILLARTPGYIVAMAGGVMRWRSKQWGTVNSWREHY